MWEYGCVKCQKYHREGEELYEPHIGFQSKHGLREVRKPAPRTQATLTVGNRTVLVTRANLSVFPAHDFIRSHAAWAVGEHPIPDKPWIEFVREFPAEVNAFIAGILEEAAPVQPLCDWLIDNGPEKLAEQLRLMMASA
jgi:hypothetical protein